MLRALTSWRALAVLALVAVAAVAVLALRLEQQATRAALQHVVDDASLVSSLVVEGDLRRLGDDDLSLERSVRRRLDADVERLQQQGRIAGLQVWRADGRLLYSDSALPDPLSPAERAELAAVLGGEAVVEMEHDDGRAAPTATVLLHPTGDAGGGAGADAVVVEVLLPQAEVTAAVDGASRGLRVGGAGALGLLLASAALARRRVRRREREALRDGLTGLGNRAALERAARTALAGGRPALLLVDLDGFKAVNDTLGHAVGDRLLVRVAALLRAAVRPQDVVVRLGADEFAVLLPDVASPQEALDVAAAVAALLRDPVGVDRARAGHERAGERSVGLEVGASIGVAAAPGHGEDVETLLRHADVATARAKRSGGGVRAYDPADDPYDDSALGLLSELRSAIGAGQLRLHYQPKVRLADGRTTGFEALVRWQHPERGLLGPHAFVPVAERTALLGPLTDWVLREAVAQCARWRAGGRDLTVAVNIAPATLLDEAFPARVVEVLAAAGLPPRHLELEITETAVLADPEGAAAALHRLRAAGVDVSVDDFGAGYTSLSYLRTLPVRRLKVDRAFVTDLALDPRDEAVVRAVVALGHDLGMDVVAEGVETEEALLRLRDLGCDEAQGYLLSRPVPADDAAAWLDARVPSGSGALTPR